MDNMNSNNLLWFFAILFLAGGNGGFFSNRGHMGPPPATQQDVTEAVNNQSVQAQLNNLGIATANNNLKTVEAISDQNMFMQNQNNTNLINIIQGFNTMVQQMQAQTANLGQRIDQLGFKMETCCCEIKTQMLQQQLAEAQARANRLEDKLDNRDQTQTILSQLGRFVTWAGTGAPTVAGATA